MAGYVPRGPIGGPPPGDPLAGEMAALLRTYNAARVAAAQAHLLATRTLPPELDAPDPCIRVPAGQGGHTPQALASLEQGGAPLTLGPMQLPNYCGACGLPLQPDRAWPWGAFSCAACRLAWFRLHPDTMGGRDPRWYVKGY